MNRRSYQTIVLGVLVIVACHRVELGQSETDFPSLISVQVIESFDTLESTQYEDSEGKRLPLSASEQARLETLVRTRQLMPRLEGATGNLSTHPSGSGYQAKLALRFMRDNSIEHAIQFKTMTWDADGNLTSSGKVIGKPDYYETLAVDPGTGPTTVSYETEALAPGRRYRYEIISPVIESENGPAQSYLVTGEYLHGYVDVDLTEVEK